VRSFVLRLIARFKVLFLFSRFLSSFFLFQIITGSHSFINEIHDNRFHAATKVAKLPHLESTFTDETRLLLYALKSQALHGPTEIKSKWTMTREERGKYETWANLGKMSNFEAMRLYVKLLEEEDKNWWEAIDEETLEIKENFGKAMTEEERMNSNNASACARVKRVAKWAEAMERGRWETLGCESSSSLLSPSSSSSSKPPCPRYQHGATLTGDGSKMIVSGGCYRGRFVADTYAFDVATKRWSKMEYTEDEKVWGKNFKQEEKESLAPISGHRLITLKDGYTYSFGGKFSKSSKRANDTDLAVFRLILMEETSSSSSGAAKGGNGVGVVKGAWIPVHVKGKRGPCARRGMSVTKVGKDGDVVVFGGEDEDRRYLNDCWRLDFKTMSWVACDENTINSNNDSAEDQKDNKATSSANFVTPAARAEHVAIPWGRDKMIIFGGTGASFKCFDDLYALDVSSGKWKAVSAASSSNNTTASSGVGSKQQQQQHQNPLARAGHCVASLKNDRYALIIGGGNNQNGVLETAVLDLNEVKWITSDDDDFMKFESPKFVGEGMSAVSFESTDGKESVLMTFGGYNGSCGNDLQVYKLPSEFPKSTKSAAPTPSTPQPSSTSGNKGEDGGNKRIAELENLLAQAREEANQIRSDARLVVDAHASLQSKLDVCERARVDAESLLKSERKIKAQLNDKLERLDRENLRLRERLREFEGNSKSWF
jgi:acyl-CoA-binding protein